MQRFEIPSGPRKGTPGDVAETKDIQYWFDKKAQKLAAEPNHRFASGDRWWCDQAKIELAKRGVEVNDPPEPKNGTSAPTPQSRAIAPTAPSSEAIQRTEMAVIGAYTDSGLATEALLKAAKHYHLISPATIVGNLPLGCEVQISVVAIDPYGREVYPISGKRYDDKGQLVPSDEDEVGLDRVALARIAGAAGVNWISSERTDDRSHPHYCAWQVWGEVLQFDMSMRRIPGSVEIDTREDGDIAGADAKEIRVKAQRRRETYEKKGWDTSKLDGGESQLLELRKFLTRMAESKAMNKMIGNMGVRRGYKRADLKRGFAVAKLAFTGRSEDARTQEIMAGKIADKFLGTSSPALYGPPREIEAPPTAPALHAPPPAGAVYAPHAIETSGKPPSEPKASAEPQDNGEPPEGFYDDEDKGY